MIKALIFDCFGVLYGSSIVANYHNLELLELISRLKKIYQIAVLSNTSQGSFNKLFTPEQQSQLFDQIVLSENVKLYKPNPQIYELTLLKLGVLPQEAILIDDGLSNIDGANQFGLKTVLFESNQQLFEQLRELGIKNLN